jgi:2-octaprenyl-6-methoxyphenol hydroxylase
VCARAGIISLRPARVLTLDEEPMPSRDLDSEGAPKTLRAGILVQAEGGLFNEQQTRATHRDYGQTAIIAQVRSSTRRPPRLRTLYRARSAGIAAAGRRILAGLVRTP